VENVLACINLVLATGRIGKPYCGYATITGQANGQGGREHGQKCDQLPGARDLANPEHRAHVAKVWDVAPDDLPQPGVDAYEIFRKIDSGEIRGLLSICFNPLVSLPNNNFVREALTPAGLRALRTPVIVTIFVAIFWSLYDQSSSAWILQAKNMDRHAFGKEWLPAQIHTLNPLLILLFIPLFSYVVYPAVNRVYRLTPVRKIAIGLFITALSFVISAVIEAWITAGQTPHIGWQAVAYVVLAAAEVMVSITGLEFSYTVAPKSMKSIVMSIWLLSVSLGNVVTAVVNTWIQNEDKTSKLPGASYYWFFTGLMLAAAVGFTLVSLTFPKTQAAEEA